MEKEIQRMGLSDEVTIFYESPRRIERTLFMIHRRVPDGRMPGQELTKIHEQYLVGTVERSSVQCRTPRSEARSRCS
jgi:16S rRNA C1402 (ribose-2'-O) methylase RsmI